MKIGTSCLALGALVASSLPICALAGDADRLTASNPRQDSVQKTQRVEQDRSTPSRRSVRPTETTNNNQPPGTLLANSPLRAVGPEALVEPMLSEVRVPVDHSALRGLFHDGGGFDGSAAQFISSNPVPSGDLPRDVAVSNDGTRAAVVHRETNNLMVIDIASQSFVHTVPVGAFPVAVGVNSSNGFAYTANALEDTVTVVNISTGAVVTTIDVSAAGEIPFNVQFTPDGSRAIVGLLIDAADPMRSAFAVVNTATNSIESSISTVPMTILVQPFDNISGVFVNTFSRYAITPNGAEALIADAINGNLARYVISTGAETIVPLAVGTPTGIDVSADGTRAVLTHEAGQQAASVVTLSNNNVATLFTNEAFANQIVRITPDGNRALVTTIDGAGAGQTRLLDLSSGSLTPLGFGASIEFLFPSSTTAFASAGAGQLVNLNTLAVTTMTSAFSNNDAALTPDGSRAVTVHNRRYERVQFFDLSTGTYLGDIQSGPLPESDTASRIAVSSDGDTVLGANMSSENAAIYDLSGIDGAPVSFADTSVLTLGVGLSPDGSTGVVTGIFDLVAHVIDISSSTTVANVPLGTAAAPPVNLAMSPDNQFAYVAELGGFANATIYKVQLDGANSGIVGLANVGTASGSTGGITFPYLPWNNVAINSTGTRLAVPLVFGDATAIINATNMSVLGTVPANVNDAPHIAKFSPDGTRVFVTNSLAGSVSQISVAGLNEERRYFTSSANPNDVAADDRYVYVSNFSGTSPTVQVFDTQGTTAPVATVALPDVPQSMALSSSGRLFVLGLGDLAPKALYELVPDGANTMLIDTIELTSPIGTPSEVKVSNPSSRGGATRVAVAEPRPDGIVILGAPSQAADLIDFTIIFGTLVSGTLNDLQNEDQNRMLIDSVFGFSATEPNLVEVQFGFTSPTSTPASLNYRYVGSLSDPGGSGRLFFRNWSTGTLEEVGTFSPSNVEQTFDFPGISAANRVRPADNRVEASMRQSVVATFAATGFQARLNHIRLTVN